MLDLHLLSLKHGNLEYFRFILDLLNVNYIMGKSTQQKDLAVNVEANIKLTFSPLFTDCLCKFAAESRELIFGTATAARETLDKADILQKVPVNAAVLTCIRIRKHGKRIFWRRRSTDCLAQLLDLGI